MTEAERNSIALFRYGILAPFIQRQVAIANKWSYFNKIAEKQYEYIDGTMKRISPSTLCRWYDAYQKDGFDALKPERRSDLGTQRKIDKELESLIAYCVCQYKNGENDSLNFHSLIEIQEFRGCRIFCVKGKR